MRRFSLSACVFTCILAVSTAVTKAGGDAKSLQGVWIAHSMEADGKPASEAAVKPIRFTFKTDKLLIAGNFNDDREEECDYRVDPTQSPKHLEFLPPKDGKAVLGIYEVKGDELKICLRHASSSDGRPAEFKTIADSKLRLIVFKRQQP
jgi:uncharacterized protein (TIGR03067 family)